MSARLSLWFCGLSILGCAAPAVGTVPPVAEPVEPAPIAAPAVAVDTGDALDAPPSAEPDPAKPDPASAPVQPRPASPRARKIAEPPPAANEHPASKSTSKHPVAPKPAGITQINDRSWTVTRSLVNQWEADPYSLGHVQEDGEGWQLIGIRSRPAYHLGMRNGDIVLEVNGHKLNTTPNLLAAYVSCKNDTKFDVVFLRNGARMTHHYEIVD